MPCGAARTNPFDVASDSRFAAATKFVFVSPLPWSAMTRGSFDAPLGTTTRIDRDFPATVIVCVDFPGDAVRPLLPPDEEDADDVEELDELDDELLVPAST